MGPLPEYSSEEIQKLIEKAQRELDEKLAAMTPGERAAFEAKAKAALEADSEKMQRTLDEAARILGKTAPAESAPKFCPNCGAPANGGKFCSFCGTSLQNG